MTGPGELAGQTASIKLMDTDSRLIGEGDIHTTLAPHVRGLEKRLGILRFNRNELFNENIEKDKHIAALTEEARCQSNALEELTGEYSKLEAELREARGAFNNYLNEYHACECIDCEALLRKLGEALRKERE